MAKSEKSQGQVTSRWSGVKFAVRANRNFPPRALALVASPFCVHFLREWS